MNKVNDAQLDPGHTNNDEDDDDDAIDNDVSTTDPSLLLTSKRVVYLGGLADAVTIPMVRAALIPFGDIQAVDMPMDYVKGKHRGFAFVEYADADDATEAIFNMDGADLAGKTISASLAQPNQVHRLQESSSGTAGMVSSGSTTDQAVWTSDEWFQNQVNSGGAGANNHTAASTKTQRDREADATTLRGENA